MGNPARRAVIDIGSNSVLLTVCENRGDWVEIAGETRITALGEGTKSTGILSERAQERTLRALADFVNLAKQHNADVIAAGTMALRIANNAGDFMAAALAQGTPVIVLTGEQEAQLGFDAITHDPVFSSENRISIIDPGGQSTELVVADKENDGWKILLRKSWPIGSLGLKSTLFPNEVVDIGTLVKGATQLDDLIGFCALPERAGGLAGGTVVVLGAAGTNLVSIRDALDTWQPNRVHGAYLDYEEVSRAVGMLSTKSEGERSKIVGLEPGREPTIHIASLIVERFLFALRAESCRVSIRGWRHALLEHSELFYRLWHGDTMEPK